MIVQEVFFWVLAVISVVAALCVIQIQDIFRAALMLVVAFLSVAGLFVLLNAEFLAVVQVLIYGGGISVLIIFAVLWARDVEIGNPSNRLIWPAIVVSMLTVSVLVLTIMRTDWRLMDSYGLSNDSIAATDKVFSNTPDWLASVLLKEWVLPFELASLILLAAIIGAIVLVRGRQP